MSIYENLGVKRVINAMGTATILGGSILSKNVRDAMDEANECFIELWELHEKAGEVIADICGAEAGWVTPGAHAALVLSAAACMAGKDEDLLSRLPDTEGMKNEIVIQACQRAYHSRSMRTPGGKIVEAGDEEGCSVESIKASITEKTAAILFNPFQLEGAVPEEEVVKIGKRHGIPVIVDSAYDCYPVEKFRRHIALGVDLSCYSGKYFGGPNSTGFVVGRKDLIEAVALHSFISPAPTCPIGRGYKLDRQEIVGLLVALKNWINLDHEKRIEKMHGQVRYLKSRLMNIDGITVEDVPDGPLFIGFKITMENKNADETSEFYEKKIRGGDPKIVMNIEDNSLVVNVFPLQEEEVKVLADMLEKILSK